MLPSSHYINKQEALFKFPMLNPDGLKGALAVSCVGGPCLRPMPSDRRCARKCLLGCAVCTPVAVVACSFATLNIPGRDGRTCVM